MTLLALLIQSYEAAAKDFGTHGTTFKIEETDMLEDIKGKLGDMERRGIIAQILTGMEKAARKTVMHPKPVEGVRDATKNNVRTFDPTFMLTQDLMDHEGRLIHPAGTLINPLDKVQLDRPLILINGTNKEQVRWAVDKSKETNGKIILTSGSPIELMKEYEGLQFFFDQQGMITNRLKIQVVPSIVTQDNDMLRVEEIAINKTN